MRTFGALLLCVLLSGCAVSEERYTPDGNIAHSITCRLAISGIAVSWSDCYQKAADICGTKGYEIIEGEGDNTPIKAPGAATSMTTRSLLIRCKD
jgi:hypothetical protein